MKEENKEKKSKTTQRQDVGKEQFFTQFSTAEGLSSIIKSQSWFGSITRIIEPSAGDGVWLKYLDVDEAYDIEPKHPAVVEANFLTYELTRQDGTLFVGNPPFGRMGTLAMQFIRKCTEFGDYIAFILPASFGKATGIRRIPNNLHLVYQKDLLDEKFRYEEDGKKLSTVFQIWEKRSYERVDPELRRECDDFSFVKYVNPVSGDAAPCPDGSDICICTHGSGYGKVHTSNYQKKNTRTHRYIKVKEGKNINDVANKLKALNYERVAKYTVGQPCISTAEIVELYLEEECI